MNNIKTRQSESYTKFYNSYPITIPLEIPNSLDLRSNLIFLAPLSFLENKRETVSEPERRKCIKIAEI